MPSTTGIRLLNLTTRSKILKSMYTSSTWSSGILAIGGVFLFIVMNHMAMPVKDVVLKLKSFQNDNSGNGQIDLFECAISFDNFLNTARTLLRESYSISLELAKKLEPLTSISVFSDENVKQFFTDVQEISRSSNYIANTLESTTDHIQEVSASAQTIADRSRRRQRNSAETAAMPAMEKPRSAKP